MGEHAFEPSEGVSLSTFAVEFAPPMGGKIGCRIRPLHQDYRIVFSHDRDPFSDMISWLERIAAGESDALWLIFEAQAWSRLQFYAATNRYGDRQDWLIHLRSSPEGEEIYSSPVIKSVLISEFCKGLVELSGASTSLAREWESHPKILAGVEIAPDQFLQIFEEHPYSGRPLAQMNMRSLEAYLSELSSTK